MIIVNHGCQKIYQPDITEFYVFCYVRLRCVQGSGKFQAIQGIIMTPVALRTGIRLAADLIGMDRKKGSRSSPDLQTHIICSFILIPARHPAVPGFPRSRR